MKTILYKPLFVNPQAYSILPCIQYPEKGEETNIEANYTGTLTITDSTGLIRSYQNQKVIDLGEYQGIITIDNITLDGAVRLGQWDISGIDTFVKPIASYRCYDNTNDDTDRDVLKDLTGNGHDIQLYNFAFTEESGYNKTTYKGALVSDGVDDYGLCENFPAMNIENGYTICAIRKWLEIDLSKTPKFITEQQSSYGNFSIEAVLGGLKRTTSFGNISVMDFDENLNFIYQTSKTYNGINISKGSATSYEGNLGIFTSLAKRTINNPSSIALYALEIYDRDLTDEEIAIVKERMIAEYEEKTGEKYPIEYPGLIAAWSAEGKTNSDPDRNILKDLTGNGYDITLNGLAFNSEGSGYEHPDYPDALVFDGVDDYGINENMPILTDYTVIFKREHLSITDSYPVAKLDVNKGSFGLDNSFNYGVNSFKTFTAEVYKEYMGNILWMTPNSLCGVKITKGTRNDTNILVLGNYGTYSNFAFYSLYLFDHSLGEQEIKSFIRKYIDPNYVLPSEQTT